MSATTRVFAALVLGLIAGAAVLAWPAPALLALVRIIEPIGTLWVNSIRMTVVPLVVSLLIAGVAPIGVFALMLPVASRTGLATAGALVSYVVVASAALTLAIVLLYPIVAVVARVPVPRFARAVLPAQVVAASSSSSLASLPAL